MKYYERVINSAARSVGLQVSRIRSQENQLPIEATGQDYDLIRSVRPFTMTSGERLWSLVNAVEYTINEGIRGDFVECGVWRGGSVMAMAQKLTQLDINDRKIWLYDTFAGMTSPTDNDVEIHSGSSAQMLMAQTEIGDGNNVWALASRKDVEQNLCTTGYPMDHFVFVPGDVAATLPQFAPTSISLLRLDTDWYESTRVELEILYPLLSVGGVCILDDYGHWQGARKAVDEYFAENGPRPLMHPIDYSGRIFIKTQ